MARHPSGGTVLTRVPRPSSQTWLALAIAAGALALRVAGPYDHVVQHGWINFQGDAWYHVRAIEHLVRNFPHRLTFDPYAGLDAPYVVIAPLFDYVVAAIALAAGLGSPSTALVERVAAAVPAIFGAGAVLLVYVIGARLFDTRSGLLAATLLAIVPGPFLDRTLLGAADHHALEVFLVIGVIALVVRGGRFTPALAGAGLGAYFLTWSAASFFAVALAAWAIAQVVLDRARSSLALAKLLVTMTAIALAMVLLAQSPALFRYRQQVASLAGLLLLGLAIGLAERVHGRKLAGAGAVLLATAAALAAFGPWHVPLSWIQDLARFRPQPIGRTIAEMQPLFLSSGSFSALQPWRVFQAAFPLGIIGLAALTVRTVKRPDAGGAALVAVWTLTTFAATLGQLRFAYYLTPMLALLSGWMCSSALAWVRAHASQRRWLFDAAIVGVAGLVFYPSLAVTLAAVRHDEGIPVSWKRTLDWMRRSTPEPFADPDTYFRRYDPAALPRPDYTVMSWWDQGYWVLRAGRRVPVVTPTQERAADAARFFLATTEADARAQLDRTRAAYVVVDSNLAVELAPDGSSLDGMFIALPLWVGRPASDFIEAMWSRRPDGSRVPVVVFHPAYYRSMAVRLARLGVERVEPDNDTWVIRYSDSTAGRDIVEATRFRTYGEAKAYVDTRTSGAFALVGLDPGRPCVPLESLGSFELVREDSDPAVSVRAFRVRPSADLR